MNLSKHLERDLDHLRLAMATALKEAISRSDQALRDAKVGLKCMADLAVT